LAPCVDGAPELRHREGIYPDAGGERLSLPTRRSVDALLDCARERALSVVGASIKIDLACLTGVQLRAEGAAFLGVQLELVHQLQNAANPG
jgi:hypothetical protein